MSNIEPTGRPLKIIYTVLGGAAVDYIVIPGQHSQCKAGTPSGGVMVHEHHLRTITLNNWLFLCGRASNNNNHRTQKLKSCVVYVLMQQGIHDTKTFTCDAGHSVTIGAWNTTAPACVPCKIVDETKKIAGYVPKFDSKRWEVTALSFNVYCKRGHEYEVSASNITACVVCKRAEHIEEDSGFAPEMVATYPGVTKFRCAAGHLFMADDRTTGCPGCRCVDIFAGVGAKNIKMVSKNTVIWGRHTYLKFNCGACKCDFYTSQNEVKGASGGGVVACPHDSSPVSRTLIMLEKYYLAAFDESDSITGGQMIRVSGYNQRLRTAVIHSAGVPKIDPATVLWCQKNNVRLFRVGGVSNVDIEKSLSIQISEHEGAAVEDILERLRCCCACANTH